MEELPQFGIRTEQVKEEELPEPTSTILGAGEQYIVGFGDKPGDGVNSILCFTTRRILYFSIQPYSLTSIPYDRVVDAGCKMNNMGWLLVINLDGVTFNIWKPASLDVETFITIAHKIIYASTSRL